MSKKKFDTYEVFYPVTIQQMIELGNISSPQFCFMLYRFTSPVPAFVNVYPIMINVKNEPSE